MICGIIAQKTTKNNIMTVETACRVLNSCSEYKKITHYSIKNGSHASHHTTANQIM